MTGDQPNFICKLRVTFMHTDNRRTQSQRLKWRLQFAVVVLTCFSVIATAQAPKDVPVLPGYATPGNANLASQSDMNSGSANPTTATPVPQRRKPTLQELYAMFFKYAEHVEARSVADEKAGHDRTDYRHHLQRASQLTEDEYAMVLAAAQRFAAIDDNLKMQLGEEIEAGSASKEQIADLFNQRDSSLNSEMANVRQLLGKERADMFDTYLQNVYIQ